MVPGKPQTGELKSDRRRRVMRLSAAVRLQSVKSALPSALSRRWRLYHPEVLVVCLRQPVLAGGGTALLPHDWLGLGRECELFEYRQGMHPLRHRHRQGGQ